MNINKDNKGRTLYCVAADLILTKGNKVLLQRRANTGWNDGKWNLVGGHIEDEETLEQCIAREAKEELGIEIKPEDTKIVHCIQYKSNRLTMQFYLTCSAWNGTPSIQPEVENNQVVYKADKLEWFDIDNLPEDLIPTARQAIKASLSGNSFSSLGFSDEKTLLP
ncbi:MAG: NUDIX domain-containing protein [Clostridia bacterium]|nr:NUDIX domain-containing protein [Clostridia bacterium]